MAADWAEIGHERRKSKADQEAAASALASLRDEMRKAADECVRLADAMPAEWAASKSCGQVAAAINKEWADKLDSLVAHKGAQP
jgi:hypothetical protein